MVKTHIEQSVDQNEKQEIQKLLYEIVETKDRIVSNRIIMKNYKVASDPLSKLKQQMKVLKEAMEEEKERIEKELALDKDYEKSKHEDLKLKNELKEKMAMLRLSLRNQHKVASVYTEKYEVKGVQMKLQLEFAPNLYLEGKPLK